MDITKIISHFRQVDPLVDNLSTSLKQYLSTVTSQLRPVILRIGLGGAAAWVIARYFVYRLYLHPVNRIPGPSPDWIPFVGNMRQIMREPPSAPHRAWTRQYGKVVSYYGPWNEPRILVTDPGIVKQVLMTQQYDFEKSDRVKRSLMPVVGEGVLLAEGDLHRQQRKLLNPAFSVRALRNLVPAFIVPARQLRDRWTKELVEDQPTEIIVSNGLSRVTLDVIGIAGFGAEFQTVLDGLPTTSGGRLSQAYMNIFSGDNSLARFLNIFVPFFRRIPTKGNLEFRHDIETLHREAMTLVEQGRKNLSNDRNSDKTLLSLMMREVDSETGKGMSTKDLQAQCLTFMTAGHETTGVALSWALWLLAKHPHVQSALRNEVRPWFEQDDCIPTPDEINALTLLNNVCKEVMRLYTPVPMVNRVAIKDVVLGGQYFIPKGTGVFIAPLVTHHDPDFWGPDVEDFRPDRWNEAPANQANPYVYMPFLAGGRQCIGYRFALLEFKVVLATLVSRLRYTEKPGFEPQIKQQMTLRPWPNMTLIVEHA
ncbi:cytochrome P450 [Dichotomocladium elegans]|nr:cytochrome P450 [Dichotomocladium elegans]